MLNRMSEGALPLFDGREPARAAYEILLPVLNNLGAFEVEEKKSSLHITNGSSAFLGVHPRKDGLRLNLVLNRRLVSDRIVKVEQVSAHRFHNEVDIHTQADVDEELAGWLTEAYERTSRK